MIRDFIKDDIFIVIFTSFQLNVHDEKSPFSLIQSPEVQPVGVNGSLFLKKTGKWLPDIILKYSFIKQSIVFGLLTLTSLIENILLHHSTKKNVFTGISEKHQSHKT
jgi:hypothetical protein